MLKKPVKSRVEFFSREGKIGVGIVYELHTLSLHYFCTAFFRSILYDVYFYNNKWAFDFQAISLQALESILTFSNGVSAPKSHPGARM